MINSIEISSSRVMKSNDESYLEPLTLKINLGLYTGKSKRPLPIGNSSLLGSYLITYLDIQRDAIWVTELDTIPKFPIRLSYESVTQAIADKHLEIIQVEFDPRVFRSMDELTNTELAKVRERYGVIQPLVENLDSLLVGNKPKGLIQDASDQSGKGRNYVYKCLNAYFYYGQRVVALALPIGEGVCHVPTLRRTLTVKQGRPNESLAQGKVLDEYDLKAFKAAKRWYNKAPYPSLIYVFKKLSRTFYYAHRTKRNKFEAAIHGEEFKVSLKPLTERPTIHQFRNWLKNQYDGVLPARDRKRHHIKEYQKDIAGRTGNAFTNVIAFGQVFEIDETPFDEELVSAFDSSRQIRIGKATLYFVIDRFTGYIVGVYITTENPSYKTIRQVIYNAAIDKREFVSSIGLNPDAIKWNFFGVASTYFVDNAEFRNKKSEGAILDLGITIKFARGGRGDDKPNVEKMFNVFSEWFQNISTAHQTKSAANIAAQISRKNACLTLNELYVIAVIYIQYHNNVREIKSPSFDLSMIRDDVRPIPSHICQWSEKYRPGYTKHFEQQELYRKLMARGDVTVHQKGIHFIGTELWYNCQYMLNSGRQTQKLNRNAVAHFHCRYNESLVDWILIETPDGLQLAQLDHKFRAFRGLSFHEAKLQQSAQRTVSAEYQQAQLEYELGVIEAMNYVFRQAKSERKHAPFPKLSTIKMNRRFEELFNRFSDTALFLEALKEQVSESTNVSGNDQVSDELVQFGSFYDDL